MAKAENVVRRWLGKGGAEAGDAEAPKVTAEQVRSVYRAVLGREAESDATVEAHVRSAAGLEQLIGTLLGSAERQSKLPRPRSAHDELYDGLHPGDEELLQRHLAPGEPEAGFVKSFVGTRMRVSHVDVFAPLSGACFNDIPTRTADYHAEPIEFVGTLRAVEAGSGPFVAVELGAGWGSWSVTAGHAARRAGRSPIRLYAVEASAGKVRNMDVHFVDNGFDPAEHTIVNAIIGPKDGFALFPLCDVTGEWGASAIFTDVEEDREGYEKVRTISLDTLLKDEPIVDMIHFDIQGAEGEVIAAAADLLTKKVRYLVVGTHARSIEGRIVDILLARGWQLENDQPVRIKHTVNGAEALYIDGTQVWRNLAL